MSLDRFGWRLPHEWRRPGAPLPPEPEVEVGALPECDCCGETAHYDAKTTAGPWAYLCAVCLDQHGVGLGVGCGQRLVVVRSSTLSLHSCLGR